MDHYLEIQLLPDPEFKRTVLMNALFAKLHRVFVDLKSTRIGISFPGIEPERPSLGDRLRLHASLGELQRLMELEWLTGMRDHTVIQGPTPVPNKVSYRVVRRVQAKSSPARLRRRLAKRKGISAEDASRAIPQDKTKRLDLPYVTIKSRSTCQEFRLFIDHASPVSQATAGNFSHYGLSAVATVPWF